MLDDFEKNALQRPCQPSSKQSVHNDVVRATRPRNLFPGTDSVTLDKREWAAAIRENLPQSSPAGLPTQNLSAHLLTCPRASRKEQHCSACPARDIARARAAPSPPLLPLPQRISARLPVALSSSRATEGVETRSARGFHQEQGRGVIVLNSQAVDLADLFSEEYGLHVWMIGRAAGSTGQMHGTTDLHEKTKKAAQSRPASPARRCTNLRLFQDT